MKILGYGKAQLVAVGILSLITGFGCKQEYTISQTSKSQSIIPPGGGPITQIDSFNVGAPGATKADILFVIDNSGSMAEEQDALASAFDSFITQFVNKNIDYHIGIISTDSKSYSNVPISSTSNPFYGYHNPFPQSNSSPGTFLMRNSYPSSPGYISQSSGTKQQVIQMFKDNAKIGIKGDGDERIIYNALQALDPLKLQTDNSGFRRDDAFVSIIGVSDENEDIRNDSVSVNGTFDHTESTPQQRIDRFKAYMPTLCDVSCPGWRVDLIVDLNAAYHQTTYPMVPYAKMNPGDSSPNVNPYPDFYVKFKEQTGSNLINIYSQTWGSNLANIANGIINQAQNQFKLSYTPAAGSLKVSLNNVQLAADAANGYSYDASSLTVQLNGSAAAGAPGKTLRIEYLR